MVLIVSPKHPNNCLSRALSKRCDASSRGAQRGHALTEDVFTCRRGSQTQSASRSSACSILLQLANALGACPRFLGQLLHHFGRGS